jgi:hypothetical protein
MILLTYVFQWFLIDFWYEFYHVTNKPSFKYTPSFHADYTTKWYHVIVPSNFRTGDIPLVLKDEHQHQQSCTSANGHTVTGNISHSHHTWVLAMQSLQPNPFLLYPRRDYSSQTLIHRRRKKNCTLWVGKHHACGKLWLLLHMQLQWC